MRAADIDPHRSARVHLPQAVRWRPQPAIAAAGIEVTLDPLGVERLKATLFVLTQGTAHLCCVAEDVALLKSPCFQDCARDGIGEAKCDGVDGPIPRPMRKIGPLAYADGRLGILPNVPRWDSHAILRLASRSRSRAWRSSASQRVANVWDLWAGRPSYGSTNPPA